ncbi:MAG: hypothetical protein MUC88_20710 [Planctomycetes bacterium]|jgi:hypothetical protein|nr:hypothetical protein [Planctomycetota bacterium]
MAGFNLEKYLAVAKQAQVSGVRGLKGVGVGKVPTEELEPTDVVIVLQGAELLPEEYTPKSGKNSGKHMVKGVFASTGFGSIPVELAEGFTVPLRFDMSMRSVEAKQLK